MLRPGRNVGIALGVAVLVLAGCSSSDEVPVASTPTEETVTTPTGAIEGTSTRSAPVVGSDQPIRIGFTNLEGGAISLPEVRTGFEQGVAYVNEELDGVNGRPIEIVRCDADGTPERSIDCANRFVEEGVVVSAQGVDLGGDAALPVLRDARIAAVGHLPFGQGQRTALGTAYYFGSATSSYGVAAAQVLSDLGARTAVFLVPEVAEVLSFDSESVTKVQETLDIEIEAITYPVQGADWSSVVAAALATKPDAIGVPVAQEQDCVAIALALRANRYDGPILMGVCSLFAKLIGPLAKGMYTYSDLWSVDAADQAPAEKRAEIEIFRRRMTAAGAEDELTGFAPYGFSLAVNLAGVLRTVTEPLSSEAVLAAFATATGVGFLGGAYRCDHLLWPGETSCSLGVLVSRIGEGGTRELVGDGPLDLSAFAPNS